MCIVWNGAQGNWEALEKLIRRIECCVPLQGRSQRRCEQPDQQEVGKRTARGNRVFVHSPLTLQWGVSKNPLGVEQGALEQRVALLSVVAVLRDAF